MLDPKRFWVETAGGIPADPTSQLDQAQAFHMQLGQLLTGSGPAPTPEQMEAFRQQMRGQMPPDAPPAMRQQAEEWLSQLASRRPPQSEATFGAWPGGPGVTEELIAAWEKERRVTLPKLLREVFQQQNGGAVRDSDVFIN